MPLSHQIESLLEQTNICSDYFNELLSLGRGLPLLHNKRTPVHLTIKQVVNSNPTRVAVVSNTNVITYAELYAWAGQISMKLATCGVKRGSHIAIFVEPSAAMIAAVLGVLKCGAAYVPLNQEQPNERISAILTDANVSGIVVDDTSEERLSDLGLPLYKIGNPSKEPEASFISPQVEQDPSVCAEDPAYLIYTSGSMGEPKGVLIGHGQLSDSTLARHMVYPGSPTFLLVSPLCFDSSVAGVWGTLTAGGKLVVASHDEVRDPEYLISLIRKHEITHLLCIPSLYEAILDVAQRKAANLSSLDTVIVAGEALQQSLVERHFSFHGQSVALVNEYGPTETTVWATYCRFDAPASVSIGGPIPGVQLYVLDENLALAPRSEIGELFIGGSQIAQGYFGRTNETKQAFLPDPFTENPDRQMYRTGDLVRWVEDGMLEFIGRKDHQVKIRGHRVELGAIESVLREMPDIRDAVVVPNKDHTLLIAFVVGACESSLDSFREHLALKLPSPMIPAQIHILDKFPLTINGKVDRAALTSMAHERIMAPSNVNQLQKETPYPDDAQLTTCVAAAWEETLNIKPVPFDVNFFDLGGHSLMIFKLQESLERHIGKRPTIVSLFRHTTVSAQAKLLSSEDSNKNTQGLEQDLNAARRARSLRARLQNTEQKVPAG